MSVLKRPMATGNWLPEYTSDGRMYEFCSCGYVVWDGADKCPRGHARGYRRIVKKRKKRFSGYSPYQASSGGFQQSLNA